MQRSGENKPGKEKKKTKGRRIKNGPPNDGDTKTAGVTGLLKLQTYTSTIPTFSVPLARELSIRYRTATGVSFCDAVCSSSTFIGCGVVAGWQLATKQLNN